MKYANGKIFRTLIFMTFVMRVIILNTIEGHHKNYTHHKNHSTDKLPIYPIFFFLLRSEGRDTAILQSGKNGFPQLDDVIEAFGEHIFAIGGKGSRANPGGMSPEGLENPPL